MIAILDCLTLENGTDSVPKRQYENAILRCVKFQKSAALIYTPAEAEMTLHYHPSSIG